MKEKTKSQKRIETIRTIIDCINNGVMDNGEVREFNIIDYYRLTKVSPVNLYPVVVERDDEFTEEDKKVFYSFVARSLNDSTLKIKDIVDIKHVVMVDDVPREITLEEKLGVITYLKENKIPRTADTYAIILKKYLEGSISLEENLEKCKALVR